MFRIICWKHGILLNINSATDPLIRVYRKISEQILLRATSRHLYLVSERYLHLKFKCYVASTCRDTFWTHSGIPDGTFARIVNLFKLTLLIYFKKSIVDISRARWYLWFVLMQAITLIFFYHWVDKSVLTLFRKQNVRAR